MKPNTPQALIFCRDLNLNLISENLQTILYDNQAIENYLAMAELSDNSSNIFGLDFVEILVDDQLVGMGSVDFQNTKSCLAIITANQEQFLQGGGYYDLDIYLNTKASNISISILIYRFCFIKCNFLDGTYHWMKVDIIATVIHCQALSKIYIKNNM